MGSHPVNLAIRFILELTALFATGFWAWNLEIGWSRYILIILLPLLLAAIWGIFAAIVVIHYLSSFDRIRWLLKQR